MNNPQILVDALKEIANGTYPGVDEPMAPGIINDIANGALSTYAELDAQPKKTLFQQYGVPVPEKLAPKEPEKPKRMSMEWYGKVLAELRKLGKTNPGTISMREAWDKGILDPVKAAAYLFEHLDPHEASAEEANKQGPKGK